MIFESITLSEINQMEEDKCLTILLPVEDKETNQTYRCREGMVMGRGGEEGGDVKWIKGANYMVGSCNVILYTRSLS